jgi:hypothetical protein
VLAKVDSKAWIDGAGVPANAPRARSAKLEALQALGSQIPSDELAKSWKPTEWTLWLEAMPHPSPLEQCAEIDRRFHLGQSGNFEILVSWLVLAAGSGYEPAVDRLTEVVAKVGRMKYLRPLYTALAANPATRARARSCYEKFKDGYHPIGQMAVEGVLKKHGA